jgi:putative two-component system response regulator
MCSALRADYQKETDLPYEDSLTGLFNNGFFQVALDREVKRSQRHGRSFTVALIDVDAFSVYNRRHGSEQGDRTLRDFARLLQENMRQADLVARYSGDVFAAIFVESDSVSSRVATERIRSLMEQLTGGDLTISAGLATFPTDGSTSDGLFQKAQEALRKAKIRGKNRVYSFEKKPKRFSAEGKGVVLVVDDRPRDVELFEALLLPLNYEVVKASSGEEALDLLDRVDVDLVLLDSMMSGMTAYEICRRIKANESTHIVPVILMTTPGDSVNKVEAIEAGVEDFLTKPPGKAELHARTRSLIRLKELRSSLSNIENVLFTLANAVEAKDSCTQGHVERVANLAVSLGRRIGLSEEEIDALRFGGILHDIGKIGVSEHILNKPGPLNGREWEIIKGHCDLGDKICVPLQSTLGAALDVIRHHHEKLDGSGYPDGLRGEEISLPARVMAVVDIFDALVTDRPYRERMPKEQALSVLHQEARAGKLDAWVVECLQELVGANPEISDGEVVVSNGGRIDTEIAENMFSHLQ